MSRRSSRLASGGYYNTDEESDSGSVTNIFYGENPVKVFKKKAGTRKARPQTPTRAQTSASSTAPETGTASDRGDGVGSFLLSSQTPTTSRTVPSVCTSVTPRPALTLSSSRCRTPQCCPSASPEKSLQAGRCSSSRPGFTLRTDQKELSLSGVDSSGYSSSEGPHRKAETAAVASSASSTSSTSSASSASSSSRTSRTSSTRSTTRINGTSGPPSNGYRSRISSPFIRLMDSILSMAVVVQSKAAALVQTPVSSGMKKACSLLLLLLTLSLCLWFLPPLLASLSSRLSVIRTPSQSPPKNRPLTPAAPPLLNSLHASPAADPTSVSAAVEERMQRVLEELLLRQEELLSQVKQNLKVDLQGMEAKLEDMDLDHRRRLDQDLSGLERRLEGQRTESLSAAAGLSVRVQVLEAQNAKLSQEWSSIQQTPPPAPCPDTSAGPTSIQLTPELQHAMEKWLADRIKEQDAIRLSDGGRPLADKMADFALETQGASVISTRCSETYRTRSACVTLFGFPLWYPSESPRTVIQGHPVLLPGKCWAFHGVQGTLVISLSHAIRITHVTLDHLPHYNSPTGRIDSAPKDFEVYGMKKDPEEGTLLGTFTYEEQGGSTQTFKLPESSEEVYRWVELRVLSNWGQVEYTCLYRFRVHGRISSR